MEDTDSALVTCPIWGTSCEKIKPAAPEKSSWEVNSPRAGGKYIISHDVSGGRATASLDEPSKVKLSRWIYEQNQLGETPEINSHTLRDVQTWPMPSALEQRDYCLQFLESKIEVGWRSVKLDSHHVDEMQAATLTILINNDATERLIEEIREIGWIKTKQGDGSLYSTWVIRSEGYQRLEELRKINVASDQGFVAMWLDRSMDNAWKEGIEPGIRDAGYKALRIDRRESNDKIDDEIIAEIRRSRFLVADFTSPLKNARGSVYYEAGFAHGLNISVIFTCRKDLVDKNHIHFDTRQYNHIAWEKPEDLRKQLKNRISATIGDGPHRNKNPQQ